MYTLSQKKRTHFSLCPSLSQIMTDSENFGLQHEFSFVKSIKCVYNFSNLLF